MVINGTQKTLVLAATLTVSIGCGPAKACNLLTSWTPQCQQEKQQADAARKAKVDYICTKMGFPPGNRQYAECYRYVNYHLNSQ
jgi:hypothetical protein